MLTVEKMKDYKTPAPLLTRSPGYMLDFIRASGSSTPLKRADE